jgi:hypothetical protein
LIVMMKRKPREQKEKEEPEMKILLRTKAR